jgi:hypothetical protein
MRLDLLVRAERPGRAASAVLPPIEQIRAARAGGEADAEHRPTSNRLTCDVCGCARIRDERYRLVWTSDPATRLVLAELCRGCATFADPLLVLYGGQGRDAIRLVEESRAAPRPRAPQLRALGFTARGILYLLIAIASFLLVTLVTSRGR